MQTDEFFDSVFLVAFRNFDFEYNLVKSSFCFLNLRKSAYNFLADSAEKSVGFSKIVAILIKLNSCFFPFKMNFIPCKKHALLDGICWSEFHRQ